MAEPPPQPLQRTVSKDDLPFNLLDDMFEAASQANPPLASIAELPDNALVNMLLSPAMADGNVLLVATAREPAAAAALGGARA